MKVLALVLLLTGGFALAEHQTGGQAGSRADIVIDESAPGRAVLVEVSADPDATRRREMAFFVWRRGDGDFARSVVPPVEPGVYRFEVDLPEAGPWGFTLRYGLGIDVYYASVSGPTIDPLGDDSHRFVELFTGGLSAGTPRGVQTAGFALFGLLTAVSLVLVAAVLRHLGRQRSVGSARAPSHPST